MADIEKLAVEVSKLSALLNDKHPQLMSWRWYVEHQCMVVVRLMEENHFLDGEANTDEEME